MSDTSAFPRFSRRCALRALLGGAALAAPAFPVLAQGETSTGEVEGRGVASPERQRFGSGPIGIAMFAPPSAGMYGRATNALVEGARAAQARDGSGITVEVVEVDADLIALRGLYDELLQRGFSMVIGPLTRDAVALIADAGAPPVFTLALNQSEGHSLPPNMLSLGLSIESEARQAASIAYDEAALVAPRPRAALVQDDSPLGARSAAAFAERWRERGGDAFESITATNTSSSSSRMRSRLSPLRADVHFVAGQPVLAQAVRVALGPRAAIYGTSRLNSGAVLQQAAGALPIRSPELDGVRLVDLPWRVQPDAPAVMAYPRPADMNLELQKLYALGIDAFRVARLLVDRAPVIDLDGVTGRLRLSADGTMLTREGVLAEYRDGVLVPISPP
ncbi:MAG: penicillin-binding protein activator [Burkholderiaceae bacterium]|jgi:outer membrane PBP1 activator LpoA protein|nr:penicillin-binding protein activator [Burkholderiaceae bacterium]